MTSGGSGGGGGGSAAGSGSSAAAEEGKAQGQQKRVTVKVGMVGDAGTGKTSLMVKYVADKFDEDYLQTLGEWLAARSRLLALAARRRGRGLTRAPALVPQE